MKKNAFNTNSESSEELMLKENTMNIDFAFFLVKEIINDINTDFKTSEELLIKKHKVKYYYLLFIAAHTFHLTLFFALEEQNEAVKVN